MDTGVRAEGRDAVFIDIANEFISLAANYAGKLDARAAAINTQATLWRGASAVASGVAWYISPAVAGVSIAADGRISIAAGYEQSVDRQEVKVNASHSGLALSAILTIAMVRGGADGTPATIYELFPSADSVSRNAAGAANPGGIKCEVLKITGSSAAVKDTTKTIKYITSANAVEKDYAYGSSISIPAAQTGGLTSIEFRLYDGSVLIDRERVPIVQDGQRGEKGDKGDIGSNAPAYRGPVTDNEVNASQYTGILKMNIGDYVMYTGQPKGIWVYGTMYQWGGANWTPLAFPTKDNRQNADKYLEGTGHLTSGAPPAVFSQAQIGSAVMDSLFTSLMNSQEIELQEVMGPDGKIRKGILRSSNYSSVNKTGFQIDTEGNAEFNNGTFRGIIEALGGIFNGTLVVGKAWDKNGNVADANARGSLLALNKELFNSDSSEIRIKNLDAYGKVSLGLNSKQGESIAFYGTRTSIGSVMCTTFRVRGSYTAQFLFNTLSDWLSKVIYTHPIPVCGSIIYTTATGTQGGTAYIPHAISISHMKKDGSNEFIFYGVSDSCAFLAVSVNNLQGGFRMGVYNDETNQAVGPWITGNGTLKFDLVFC
jgi:hypothetical protein